MPQRSRMANAGALAGLSRAEQQIEREKQRDRERERDRARLFGESYMLEKMMNEELLKQEEEEKPNKKGRNAPQRPPVSAIIKGYQPLTGANEDNEHMVKRDEFEKEAALHKKVVGELTELCYLATELDQNFHTVHLPKCTSPALPGQLNQPVSGKASAVNDVEEVIFQLELQTNPRRNGGAQGLVLRTNCSWEFAVDIAGGSFRPQHPWSASTRPSTPSDSLPGSVRSPNSARPCSPVECRPRLRSGFVLGGPRVSGLPDSPYSTTKPDSSFNAAKVGGSPDNILSLPGLLDAKGGEDQGLRPEAWFDLATGRIVGDAANMVFLELKERIPELVSLRRVKTQSDKVGGGGGFSALNSTSSPSPPPGSKVGRQHSFSGSDFEQYQAGRQARLLNDRLMEQLQSITPEAGSNGQTGNLGQTGRISSSAMTANTSLASSAIGDRAPSLVGKNRNSLGGQTSPSLEEAREEEENDENNKDQEHRDDKEKGVLEIGSVHGSIEDLQPSLEFKKPASPALSHQQMTMQATFTSASRFVGDTLNRLSRTASFSLPANFTSSTTQQMQKQAAGFAQSYMRDLRMVLQLISESMPKAARHFERALKGLILSMDTQLSALRQYSQSLEANVSHLRHVAAEAESLKQAMAQEKIELLKAKETLERQETRREEEVRQLHARIDSLKAEVEALTPDPAMLDSVAGIMGDCTELLDEMEDECVKQGAILQEMSNHTGDVARISGEDPIAMRRPENGRVIELKTGEILLRPYGVRDEGTQVNDVDITRCDEWCPISLRLPNVRLLLAANAGREPPAMSVEELCSEIDNIYTAKIASDAECEHANAPARELLDFVIEYYLEKTLSLEAAERKLCGIIQCIRNSEKSRTATTPKIALFARFLQICSYDKALPLPLLSAALRAKRHAQTSFTKTRELNPKAAQSASPAAVSARAGRARESVAVPGLQAYVLSLAEAQLPIAIAYEAGIRALPGNAAGAGARELFVGLARGADIEGMPPAANCDNVKRTQRDFLVLVTLLHSKLQREAAPEIRDLITRAEKRDAITTDDFRDALRACQLGDVDEHIWRSRLAPSGSAALPTTNQLSTDALLEHFCGGAPARTLRPMVPESNLLSAVASALCADFAWKADSLEALWSRKTQARRVAAVPGTLEYTSEALPWEECRAVVKSAQPNLPESMIRALYHDAVDMSRSCFQLAHGAYPTVGNTQMSPNGNYGGEVVTFKHLSWAAMKFRIFSEAVPQHSKLGVGQGRATTHQQGGRNVLLGDSGRESKSPKRGLGRSGKGKP